MDEKYLKKIVDHQANIEGLWPVHKPTLQEAMLSAALRHLHAVIEGDEYAAMRAKKLYWDLESEL